MWTFTPTYVPIRQNRASAPEQKKKKKKKWMECDEISLLNSKGSLSVSPPTNATKRKSICNVLFNYLPLFLLVNLSLIITFLLIFLRKIISFPIAPFFIFSSTHKQEGPEKIPEKIQVQRKLCLMLWVGGIIFGSADLVFVVRANKHLLAFPGLLTCIKWWWKFCSI